MSKKKEAQKLSTFALSKINELTKKKTKVSSAIKSDVAKDDIAALEAAFGNLDAKLN